MTSSEDRSTQLLFCAIAADLIVTQDDWSARALQELVLIKQVWKTSLLNSLHCTHIMQRVLHRGKWKMQGLEVSGAQYRNAWGHLVFLCLSCLVWHKLCLSTGFAARPESVQTGCSSSILQRGRDQLVVDYTHTQPSPVTILTPGSGSQKGKVLPINFNSAGPARVLLLSAAV